MKFNFLKKLIILVLLILIVFFILSCDLFPIDLVNRDFNPIMVGGLSGAYASNIFIEDDYLYNAYDLLEIIDINDMFNPNRMANYKLGIWSEDFFIKDNLLILYFNNYNMETMEKNSGIQIIDITDKNTPIEIGIHASKGNIADITVLDDSIYAGINLFESKEDSWEVTDSWMEIIDIADATKPVLSKKIENIRSEIGCLAADKNNTYIYTRENFQIINNLTEEKIIITDYANDEIPSSLFIDKKHIYAASDNNLQIIDISNKEAAKIIGKVECKGYITKFIVERSTVYLIYTIRNDELEVIESGLQIIDTKNKNNPEVISDLQLDGECSDISVSGEYAYIASGLLGIQIIKLY